MKKLCIAILSAVLSFLATIPAAAQAAAGVYADANNPSGAPDPQKLNLTWQVDNLTGALNVKIPFPTGPTGGRGPHIPFSLLYNSSSTVTLQGTGTVYVPGLLPAELAINDYAWITGSTGQVPAPVGPWTSSGPFFYYSQSAIPTQSAHGEVTYYGCTIYGPYIYTDSDGASHDLNLELVDPDGHPTNGACSTASINASTTTDGSALLTSRSSFLIIGPDGTAYSASSLLEDTNGNTASFASDSEGRTPFKTTWPIGVAGMVPPGNYTVTTYGSTGSSEVYEIGVSSVAIGKYIMPHPAGSADGVGANMNILQPAAGQTLSFITSIELPDGTTSYTFTPDPTYGTISKITFPTGGYVRFLYGVRSNGGGYGYFANISTVVVTDVYLSTGSGAESHWTYNFAPSITASGFTTTVTAPDGTSTQYMGEAAFWPTLKTSFGFGKAPTWQETEHLVMNSAGTLVQSVATSNSCHSVPSVTTTYYDGASPLQQQVQVQCDLYNNNIIEKDESGFYSCTGTPCPTNGTPPTGWLRKTFTTYQYQNQPSWVTAHIVNKPSQILVTDGSGHPYELTQYDYDETAVTGPSGIMNHDDANYSVSSTLPRGNLTSEHHCSVLSNASPVTPSTAPAACSSWLVTTHTYDIAGQRLTTVDPKGYTTTFSYTDNYLDGSPAKPTDGYVTKITYPNNATDQYSYYYPTGELATHTDWNSRETQYFFTDSLNRLVDTYRPASAQNGGTEPHIHYAYSDGSNWSLTITDPIGGTYETLYDGLGRVLHTQRTFASGIIDHIDSTYDAVGNVQSVSNPYLTTGDPSYGITSFLHDSLRRKTYQCQPDNATPPSTTCTPAVSYQQWTYAGNVVTFKDENGNQWTRTSDGLGRLTSVAEPGGQQTGYSYDVLDNLLSATQNGVSGDTARNRSFTYDSLSRLLCASNPENSENSCPASPPASGTPWPSGTTLYVYDANGNVSSKTDARGIATSYTYDAQNRVLSKTYSDGSLSSCYQYDGSGGNRTGRLTNEWTQAGACPGSPSSAFFTLHSIASYDEMGRITSEQQCTPGGGCTASSGPQLAYTYDLAGNQATLTNSVGEAGSPLTLTNYVDLAGHTDCLTSSWATLPTPLYTLAQTSQQPCSSTASKYGYGAVGPLNWTLGPNLPVTQVYTNRLWTQIITAAGQVP